MICPACGADNADGVPACYMCSGPLGAAAGLQPGGVVASRYEIQGLLGTGGMGTVYKAHDRVLDETVALKVLRPEIAQDATMARRFLSEIKLARKVTHRNVCRIHDYGQDGSVFYLSMEFVAGTNLRRVLEAQGGLLAEGALEVGIEIAKGLQAIHDVGIIHRDLKPLNIMLDSRGVVRLMDFGIAKERGVHGQSTATGVIVGTPEYMSPEQVRGETVDFRSDVYALGIVLFELFTGRAPFRGPTVMATLYQQVHTPAPVGAATAIPAAVRPLLARALAKDPAARQATAGELADALRRAHEETFSSPAAPVPAAAPAPAPAKAGAPRKEAAGPSPEPLIAALDSLMTALEEAAVTERLLDVLVGRTRELAGAEAARALLFDHEGVVEAAAGHGAEDLRGLRLTPGEAIAAHVAESGVPVRLPRASAHPRYSSRCDELGAAPGFLCLPLRRANLRGAVLLAGRAPDGFSASHEDAARRLTRHAAVLLSDAVAAERSLDAFTHASEILLSVLESLDVGFPDHGRSVAALADTVAPRLGLGEEEQLQLHFAALLHDVGKIRIDPAVLRVKGPLDDEQRRRMREHVVLGLQLVAPLCPFKEVPRIIHAHHERWDGTGYPQRLAGEAIPLGARIVSVADAFDAMRRRNPAQTEADALSSLERLAGSQFDPRVVTQFVAARREGLARLGR